MEITKKALEVTCCKPFESMVSELLWYTVEEEGQVFYVMPCIESNGRTWRVNFCPSCGKNVRGIQIESDEFMSIYL